MRKNLLSLGAIAMDMVINSHELPKDDGFSFIPVSYTHLLYGAAFACAGIKKSPVSVVAVTPVRILQIKIEKVMHVCPNACPCHQQVIQNLVYLLARKNVALSEKIQHISKRSTREKLLAYLADEIKKTGRKHFQIPFSRQELADYLCVDRSAMSAELGKLKREGIIEFRKNEFWVL